ncbi:aldose 1-epimerase family protein [Microbacterium sp. X-17]|uniref:aldose 1-epimerase family protein n=1 Tax=Microbacterium sp. X-17 TaxID=3144404 RepID=UPI0031F575C6
MVTPISGTQHILRAGEYEATVASVGATLRSLTYHGRDLVVPFGAGEVRPAFRGATLAPWPNRIVDGRYTFDGAEHQTALTEPGRGHALHGLAAWLEFTVIDKGPDHVALAGYIEAQTGYPWRLRLETSYALGPDGLRQEVIVMNRSDVPAPFGTGTHPYVVAGPGRVDDWTLELPASEVLLVTEDRLIPTELAGVDTDPARFDFREARAIGAARIDHAFTGLARDADGRAAVRVTDATGAGVEVSWDASCPWLQIHTADRPAGDPGDRIGLAVEPMTCAPDAFNADRYPFDTGLQVIPGGETASASWRISALV